jgi:dTDP-4-dehydrorhamnose 3,5-epimerase-like enzyme
MTLDVRRLAIPDVLEIVPRKFGDDRGFFSETYNTATFAEAGVDIDFVQDNQSLSVAKHVVRGLHYQLRLSRRTSWCGWCAGRSSTSRWTSVARRRHSVDGSRWK